MSARLHASITSESTVKTAGPRFHSRIASEYQRIACAIGTRRISRDDSGRIEGVRSRRRAGVAGNAKPAVEVKAIDASRRFAEVGGAHLGIVQQRGRLAPECNLPGFHHVAAIADFERQLRVLLDQQDRHAFLRRRR